ncbi:hypothetical protein Acr_10g0006870 [Actinidia rufa]|uniref:Uncharacterized protein n=1 Tax=Actinidia rufa TaxID=165716 RepID=A0A7J0F9B9_9ERIC|nr:hypothetical protein Acr_10g0006870 [Actinidia rufa]
MRFPSPHSCDLIVDDHSPAVIWVVHFDCEDLVPLELGMQLQPKGETKRGPTKIFQHGSVSIRSVTAQ